MPLGGRIASKCDSSYWRDYVDALHSMQNSKSSVKCTSSSEQAILRKTMSMLDQFHPCIHDSIENTVDVKDDGNCGYHTIIVLLDMSKDS